MMLAMSVGWSWRKRLDVRRIKAVAVAMHVVKSDYKPDVLSVSIATNNAWLKPTPQLAGGAWIYELFTPPVIFYNRQSAAFSVTSPSDLIDSNAAFDLQVVAVKQELYRLQLTGYFGKPGAYIAAFSAAGKPDILLVKEGDRLKDLHLKLLHFAVQHLPLERKDSLPAYEAAAVAELFDEQAEATVTLDSRSQKFSDASVAIIKFAAPDAAIQEVREGDVVRYHEFVYRIEHIQYAPAEVQVTREGSDTSRFEHRVLHPATVSSNYASASIDDSKISLSRPATGLATNNK